MTRSGIISQFATRQLSRPKVRLLSAGRLAQQRVVGCGTLRRENDSPVIQRCRFSN